MIKKIFITGGCGFIGSHITEFFYNKYPKAKITVFDKITYAASQKNISHLNKKRLKIIKKDILNFKLLKIHTKKTDLLIHAAAESHVDKSYIVSDKFIYSNVLGTKNIMQAALENKIKNIVHISTDEVYGEIYRGSFSELSNFNPSNPYSSSKAAAEMIVNGYIHSYKLPVKIIRANNIFGTRQHPEKLIAGICWCLLKNRKFTIHGSGQQKRKFLHVNDLCKAVDLIYRKGKLFECYNIGSNFEYKVIDLIKIIIKKFNKNFKESVKFVQDRPFNDYRYSIKFLKLKKLGWKPKIRVEEALEEIILWYRNNYARYKKRM